MCFIVFIFLVIWNLYDMLKYFYLLKIFVEVLRINLLLHEINLKKSKLNITNYILYNYFLN